MTANAFTNENFTKKIPLLIASLALFLITLYSFIATGINFSTLINVASVANLATPQLIIFIVAFALAITTTSFYGSKLEIIEAAVPLILFLIIALMSTALIPAYAPLFIMFAITFGLTAILASREKKETNHRKYVKTALTVFLVLIVAFSIVKVELNKEAYFDQFINSAVQLNPQVLSNNTQVSEAQMQMLKTELTKVPFFQSMHDYFSIFVAIAMLSLAGIFNTIINLATWPINKAADKLSVINLEVKE
ncbi:MAG: hypothetical protein V1722_04010 [Candidatus Micrarchaeota archaeon]